MRAVGLLVLLASSTASADFDRVGYVARALAAIHALGAGGRDQLERDLYAASRTRCHADVAPPTATCLIDAATARCAGDATCEAAADVVALNLRAANDWVDQPTRARLVRESADYRAALAAELHRRYASLAAELVFDAGGDAAAIDRRCRTRDQAVHACRPGDAACVPSLSWSRCVAALVWFVGGRP